MNEKLIGRFYFKITKNGNLIGEFSNNLSPKNFTESADLIKQDVKGFEGNYYSSWLDDTDVKSANLFIRIKKGCKDIYTVNWKVPIDVTMKLSFHYFHRQFREGY